MAAVATIAAGACALTACRPELAPSRGFLLSDHSVLQIDERGGWTLDVDGREVFGMHGSVRARTFSSSVKGPTALYTFTEADVSRTDIAVYLGATSTGTGAVLSFESGDATAAAQVMVEPWQGEGAMGAAVPPATQVRIELVRGAANSLAIPVVCAPQASFLGFGAQYNQTDQRGESFVLFVSEQGIGRDPSLEDNANLPIVGDEHTTYFPMPWWLDARGHGVLVRTAQRVTVDLCARDNDTAWIEVFDGAPVELLILHGPSPKDVVRQLGDVVGRAASPPDWALRPWIAAQGGTAVVEAEVAALEDAEVPFGALWVQDWTGIRMNLDGGFGVKYRWVADEALYPGLVELIAGLHDKGVRFLGYANPFVPTNLDHFAAMEEQGLLIQADGATHVHINPAGLGGQPDLSDPVAREYVRGYLNEMVETYGMDGWMVDFGEWAPLDGEYDDGRDPIAAHNRYPIEWQALNREVLEHARPDGDWVMFSRAGHTGVQGTSMIHWVGDQEADWSDHDGLPTVVPAMLNLGLSGQAIVTHDIAGFSGGPSTKELYLRWIELGAFSPIMRTHQGANKLDNWSWNRDAETIAHFRRFAAIHEALGPELRTWRDEAVATSIPMVRHLVLEFPGDPLVATISDEFMLGDRLLVAPVVGPGVDLAEVYLPSGATWFHLWSGEAFEGGEAVQISAPIGQPPVFTRDVDRPDLRAIE